MLHIVETPSKRPFPDGSGSILMELSNRLYDSVPNPSPRSELEICVNNPDRDLDLGSKIGAEVSKCVETVFCASKNRKTQMLRMKFWTSESLVKKWSKRPWDPHSRIRLEKLCPKVVSDCQNAGRMPSKRRFLHFRPIMENPGLNVNFSPQSWGHSTPNSTICFEQRVILRSIKWQGQADFYPGIK